MKKTLGRDFFNRSTPLVARELLGKYLVIERARKQTAHRIEEVEAYDGPHDLASHASRGETPRNSIMFGEAGHWYVYFVYGMYEMLNIVTGERGYPAAVLIRGVEGFSGPGKLTRGLGIDRRFNHKKASRATGLWIEDRGEEIPQRNIKTAPRIGVTYAGKVWAGKRYRFFLEKRKQRESK